LLFNILDDTRGPIPSPIRAEVFGPQRMAEHARNLGTTHLAQTASGQRVNFFPRLSGNMAVLREAQDYIALQASTGYDITPAAEWLIDNFHLIESQVKEIHKGLPRSYFRNLPILVEGPIAGLPRIYGVVWAFVAHTDGAFDEALLVQFLRAYQETRELNLSEMWALPTTLRVVLIENLRRLAEKTATNKAAREAANLCFDRLESYCVDALDDILTAMEQRGVAKVFLAQMAQRLQDHRVSDEALDHSPTHQWIHNCLPDLAQTQTQQSAEQAADNISVSNAVTSLRAVGDADWPEIIAQTSTLMRLMLTSPVFAAESIKTRDQSLHAIESLSKRSKCSEQSVAQTLLWLMQSAEPTRAITSPPGYWLRGAGRAQMLRTFELHKSAFFSPYITTRSAFLPLYLCALFGLSVALLGWLMGHAAADAGASTPFALSALAVLLMIFPASEAVVALSNRLISESVRPQYLPRLALTQGIPIEHRALVVIPCMLTSEVGIGELVHRLELHYLANPEDHLQFALLSDWADANTQHTDTDAGLLSLATRKISEINVRYPKAMPQSETASRFIVLHRNRQFSETEQCWIGWERKRGKLELLIQTLAQEAGQHFLDLNAESVIANSIQYLITVDSDTQLPPGCLRQLVGTAAHPNNQPQLDPTGTRVVSGYGILQPRISTPLSSPKDFTLFHWLFAGQCGIDPYSAASSEVYQDVFSAGTFTGKGLLNVRALHAVLSGRLPVGQILSHDLIEGAIARCAAVTDIVVIEEAPFHADVAASRVHRWTRGDWQLLPVLFAALCQPGAFPMQPINLWKIFDNLRRSLVAPMAMALLVLSLSGTGISPWAALTLVTVAFCAGPLMGALAGFSSGQHNLARHHFYREASLDLLRSLLGGIWHAAMLLQHALMAIDAIARALYRTAISRRQLLQWTTADVAQSRVKSSLGAMLRQHWTVPCVAALLFALLLLVSTPTPVWAFFLCLIWFASPVWTWWVSRAPHRDQQTQLSAPQHAYLEGIGRDTWRLFERAVTAADRHLPPDNLQLTPHEMLAHRTSPSNIGLYLLSVTCAREFGWIGTQNLLARLESTLSTLLTLERHRGHFLNWYETQSGAALSPLYVSTVGSGNLSGHLLAVSQACRELAPNPYDVAPAQHALAASRQRLGPLLSHRTALTPALRQTLRWLLVDHRTTKTCAAHDTEALAQETVKEFSAQQRAAFRLQSLAQSFEELAWQADYSFLFNERRKLFHIGYRVTEQQLDSGFYDLLASESRLTSLLAIAKGDAPAQHWAALGRLFYATGTAVGLRSWSGSMFEYLMPSLVLIEPHGSVLRSACEAALREQMLFAQQQGVPWGISESAYAAVDHTLAYQYAPQGATRLALRRTPPNELVIAPYATALAAQIAPHRAHANFTSMEELGARGRYGFMEALDFTPTRRANSDSFTPVNTFMAHHQGMTVVALANVLLGGVAQRWGMSNPMLQAVASLLHERVPREVPILNVPPSAVPVLARLRRRAPSLLRDVLPGGTALAPTHLLSNGRYSVALRPNGAGWSRWDKVNISRDRDDALRDAYGNFLYIRWPEGTQGKQGAKLASITQHPAPDDQAQYRCTFHTDRVCMSATWPKLQTHVTVWVSPEDDVEFRQVELFNRSDSPIELELLSAFEVCLSEPRADESHPAFTNLFIRAQWLASEHAVLLARQPRLPGELALQVAHFLVTTPENVLGLRVQTDRQRWQGRNQTQQQPAADMEAPPANQVGADSTLATGLDPVCALGVRMRIAAHTTVKITFATAASPNLDTVRAMIDKYHQPSNVSRASLMSATLAGIRLRALRISPENFAAMQSLTTALVLSVTRPRAAGNLSRLVHTGLCDRRPLLRVGLSGDRPIVLLSVSSLNGLGLLRAMAQSLNLWAWSGIAYDLVVVNAEPASYMPEMQREIVALRERHLAEAGARNATPTTLFVALRSQDLSSEELSTLKTLARISLHADGRPLAHHVQEWVGRHDAALDLRQDQATTALAIQPRISTSSGAPSGTFDAAGSEFSFQVSATRRTLRPWINVLSNPSFGAQISEAGGGYTWALNSRLNQLTDWSNDPVGDPPGEWFLVQDTRTLDTWSITPSAWGAPSVHYEVSHGQGYSTISHRYGALELSATWCVDAQTAVKHVAIQITNHGTRARHLRIAGLAEWIMGTQRTDRNTLRTAAYNPQGESGNWLALLATQLDHSAGFGGGTAFFALVTDESTPRGWTCDRRELFDARGRMVLPDHFSEQSGVGLDPCAAISTQLQLAPGQTCETVFLLGYAPSANEAQQLIDQSVAVPVARRLQTVQNAWNKLLGATVVKTPDPLFDALVNRWLLYQTVACRLWAKAGFYQAGGATGFRDQLQDAMALAWAEPDLLRQQIVLCASRQFPEGDVQHWWHDPGGAGVRTHFSDDLLWLVHATHHYLKTTGDIAVLDQRVPFLDGHAIPEGAEDAYYTPSATEYDATIYEHAARAIDHSLRVGVHGLPLMGSGDWNDGMNRVGIEGKGESVWLGWFLCQLVQDFAPRAQARGEQARAQRWQEAAAGWEAALLGNAWDREWFKRAYFNDGQSLGSHTNTEARIDLIAQAWAGLSKVAPPARQRQAMESVESKLVDRQAGLIRLLHPPFQNASPSAGYIQAYPPGVRENGGQYTHAGVWGLMAAAQRATGEAHGAPDESKSDTPYRYFTYLSPAHRAAHPTQGSVYGIEPYVMAGDVYSHAPYVGRGGWSWYTGSAAWMHRAAIESIFGLHQEAQTLVFRPCLPSDWSRAELTLTRNHCSLRFILLRANSAEALRQTVHLNAVELPVGESMAWPKLPTGACFVIPLLTQ
jgi:cyclic beta-1,2-glucan synthetase